MTEKEARKIAEKSVKGFTTCVTLEKGDPYVFLFSGRKTIPDKMAVAVTSDGKVGSSFISAEEAKSRVK